MKKLIIMSILSTFLHLIGCSSVSEKTPASSSSENVVQDLGENSSNNMLENTVGDLTPSVALNIDLQAETAFHYLLSENELKSDYVKAAALIKQQLNISGEVAETSFRFAGWFVIVFKKAAAVGDEAVLDAPTHEMSAYLVDLVAQKVIAKGDFEAARAVIDRILDVSESGLSERKYKRLVNHFCALSSTVAFGHNDYVEGDPTDDSHAPTLRKDEQGFVLSYDINVGGGTSVEYQHMTLKISKDQITYQVDAI